MRILHGRRACGLTLVEAVIVLAIAAIIVSAAAPGLRGLVESMRLQGAAAQLATDLHHARAESVLRNTAVRFTLQSGPWGQCYVVHTGSAGNCSCAAAGLAQCSGDAQQLRTVRLSDADGVQLQAKVRSILFDPLHGTATPTGTLRLVATSGRAVHQVVNLMGRVRSCSPQGQVAGHAAC